MTAPLVLRAVDSHRYAPGHRTVSLDPQAFARLVPKSAPNDPTNQLNTVAVYRLGARLRSAHFVGNLPSAGLDIPTTAAFQSGRLWAVNARFGTAVTPDTEYWITRLPARP